MPTPGGGGQVLIKSVNGKVVITPVPGTGNNPPLPPAPAAMATPAVVKPASPMTVAMKAGGGGGTPVVNGGGEQHNNNINCNSSGDNGQVGLHSSTSPLEHAVYAVLWIPDPKPIFFRA